MRTIRSAIVGLVIGSLFLLAGASSSQEKGKDKDKVAGPDKEAIKAAVENGFGYLMKNQAQNGSWGKTFNIAVTSFAVLAFLSADDEPYRDERGKALIKGLNYLLSVQKDGMFPQQDHTWIHGQGFGTLALSEAYGRSLFCKTKPDIDTKKLKEVVTKAVKIIGENQSNSGGWWYTPNNKNGHEGSTTVCAVQALVSAKNFGIPIDEKVLDKGFEYLKKCQTKEGGFNYMLGDGRNMNEGTAGGVATLGLMQKFDFQVMINGFNYLQKIKPATISQGSFPYYGHFYGVMGMHLLWQEYKVDKNFSSKTKGYIGGVYKDLLSWQEKDGSWPLRPQNRMIHISDKETPSYGTAFALITLMLPESRASIYNREPPKLPKK
jgi:hypothetical protein